MSHRARYLLKIKEIYKVESKKSCWKTELFEISTLFLCQVSFLITL